LFLAFKTTIQDCNHEYYASKGDAQNDDVEKNDDVEIVKAQEHYSQ